MKQKCRLSLNLAREGRPQPYGMDMTAGNDRMSGSPPTSANDGYQATDETLHIRSQRDNKNHGRLEQMEVTLSR